MWDSGGKKLIDEPAIHDRICHGHRNVMALIYQSTYAIAHASSSMEGLNQIVLEDIVGVHTYNHKYSPELALK